MVLTSGIVATATTHQPNQSTPALPLSKFTSGEFLALQPGRHGGIILQKPFYTDFVGAGGAIGCSFDLHCTAIYPIGRVDLYIPTTQAERQRSFQKRIAYSQQLADIAALPSALERAYRIVQQLCDWVGTEQGKTIPLPLVARLAGVSPHYVKVAWEKQEQDCRIVAHGDRPL